MRQIHLYNIKTGTKTPVDKNLVKRNISPEDMLDETDAYIRYHRNKLLSESDWTQNSDLNMSPEVRKQWNDYRQALRDLPAQVDISKIKSQQDLQSIWPRKPA